jgi:AcrR family transcriptional regulator
MKYTMPDTAYIAHADQRTADILASARRAFVEKGFDGASMQDLARNAGMSVGNFYRYFPSKAAIVEALIAQDMEEMSHAFGAILTAANPMEALRHTVHARITEAACESEGALWAEINAASLRKPEIAAITQKMETQIVENLTRVFALATGWPEEVTHARFASQAALMVLLVQAAAMQSTSPVAGRTDLNDLIIRMIDQILDAIAASTPLES